MCNIPILDRILIFMIGRRNSVIRNLIHPEQEGNAPLTTTEAGLYASDYIIMAGVIAY